MVNFALEGPKWASTTVTWSFASVGDTAFTNAISPAYQQAIRTAAAQWSAATNVSLQEVSPGTANTNVVVGWGSFSGNQIGETDYSYNLGTTPTFRSGMTIRIEDPSLHALSSADGAYYQGTTTTLEQVALHEFGHALGLGLSSDPNAIMNLALGPSNTAIDDSDLAGVAALYGAKSSIAAAIQASAAGTDTVTTTAGNIGIYRFFDASNGTQFLTSSTSEINSIFATRPDLHFEGLAMGGVALGTSTDSAAAPIYRFFDTSNGAHFFTASAAEAKSIAATRSDMVAEAPSFAEHLTQQAGDSAVYRFFDTHAGTHFFTSSASEQATIVASRPDLAYEGIAFYAPTIS